MFGCAAESINELEAEPVGIDPMATAVSAGAAVSPVSALSSVTAASGAGSSSVFAFFALPAPSASAGKILE
jgi:hypothetical protein